MILNISALLVKWTQTIAKIGIKCFDFRFQERKLQLFLLCPLQSAIPFLFWIASSWGTPYSWLKVHFLTGGMYDKKAGILNMHC